MYIAAAMVKVTMLMQLASLISLISKAREEISSLERAPVHQTDCKPESLINKHSGVVHNGPRDWSYTGHLGERSHDREDGKTREQVCDQSADGT